MDTMITVNALQPEVSLNTTQQNDTAQLSGPLDAYVNLS